MADTDRPVDEKCMPIRPGVNGGMMKRQTPEQKTVNELPKDIAAVERLIGKEDSPTVGKKLIKAGTFLIVAVPEPFISDLTGTAIIATGLALNKISKKGNIKDIYRNLQENLQEIERFKREVSHAVFFPE